MNELFLIPIILAFFAFGYYIMVKIDRFTAQNQRQDSTETVDRQNQVRIAAESPLLLDSIAAALDACANAAPHIEFFKSSGAPEDLLEKLLQDQVDIVLLSHRYTALLDRQYAVLHIPCKEAPSSEESPAETPHIQVVWKGNSKSKNRDRVIFILEMNHCAPSRSYLGE